VNNWRENSPRDRIRDREMEALGALAVAERDILVRFAHSDSGPLRRLRPSAREPASPFQSAREMSVGIGY